MAMTPQGQMPYPRCYCAPKYGHTSATCCPAPKAPMYIDPVCDTPIQCTQKDVCDVDGAPVSSTRQYYIPALEGAGINFTQTTVPGTGDRAPSTNMQVCIPGLLTFTQESGKDESMVHVHPGVSAERVGSGIVFHRCQGQATRVSLVPSPRVSPVPAGQPQPLWSGPQPGSPSPSSYQAGLRTSAPQLGQTLPQTPACCPPCSTPGAPTPRLPGNAAFQVYAPVQGRQTGAGGQADTRVYVVHKKYQTGQPTPPVSSTPLSSKGTGYSSPPSGAGYGATELGQRLLSPTWQSRQSLCDGDQYPVIIREGVCNCPTSRLASAVSDIEVWEENQSFDAKHEATHVVPLNPSPPQATQVPADSQTLQGRTFRVPCPPGAPEVKVTYVNPNTLMIQADGFIRIGSGVSLQPSSPPHPK